MHKKCARPRSRLAAELGRGQTWLIGARAPIRHKALPSGSGALGARQRCRTPRGVKNTERRQRRPPLRGLAMEEGERWWKFPWCQDLQKLREVV